MGLRSLLIFIIWIVSFTGLAQEFNYIHYDTRDGLAGSTVYDMCQDVDGFMWFATENGLSRYDGTSFVNFTVKDGLPDNEVLKIFADSKGRVWIGCFSKVVSYYYKGRIYNDENDKMLADPMFKMQAFCICEDSEGNVAISDFKKIIEVTTAGEISEMSKKGDFQDFKFSSLFILTNHFGRGYLLIANDSVYKCVDNKISFFFKSQVGKIPNRKIGIRVYPNGETVHIKTPIVIIGETKFNHTNIYESTIDGAWSVDTVNNRLADHFLPGLKISKTLNDSEKNIWFSTLGNGIYKLPTKEMKTIHFSDPGNNSSQEVFSVAEHDGSIIAGLGFSKMAMIKNNSIASVTNYSSQTVSSSNSLSTNRLYCSYTTSSGDLLLGFDAFLAKWKDRATIYNNIISIKSIAEIDSQHVMVGTYAYTLKVRISDLKIVDTIWKGRSTEVFFYKDQYYIGTINGLHILDAKKNQRFHGDRYPALKRRIVAMGNDKSGLLYVATADAGLIVLHGDSLVYAFTDQNGLSSNICRSLFIDKDVIWLGTNKGINKIRANNPSDILKFSVADGLPSDNINALYVKDSIVWVGSPAGLTFFNENKISNISECHLILLETQHDGEKNSKNQYKLSYKENHIAFNYIAISHKSAGAIVYHYKLAGLDNEWNTTNQSSLEYRSLPPGNYQLNLYAVNKFGVKSDTITVTFYISTPFWRTWWFYFFILSATAILTAWLVSKRNQSLRKRLEEKNKFQKQFADLEQQALQAQMNPHFIFNSLNSIQQFILTNNKQKANLYLTGFASLIRQTLDISAKSTISLAEEVEYLSKYLEMEKMRSGERFSYHISILDGLKSDYIELPALLLQPFVENAVRHGIRYKEEGDGKVEIKFFTEADMLICSIADNGVGRKKTASYKSLQHIEYQSKGILLTNKRIALINNNSEKKLSFEIFDHEDADGNATGTEVIIKIPIIAYATPNSMRDN